MILLGIYTFLVGLFGTFAIPSGNKIAVLVFAVLIAIAFLAQIGSIFIALEVRSDVEKDDAADQKVLEDMDRVSWYNFSRTSEYCRADKNLKNIISVNCSYV